MCIRDSNNNSNNTTNKNRVLVGETLHGVMSVDSVTPGARTVLQIPLSGCLSPRSWKWAPLACYSSEDVQKCVAEGRRRSHCMSRIARSGQDLAIRGLGMRANTAKTHRSTFSPNSLCARLAFLVCYSSEDAKRCVPESRRRSALRGRIAISRQDLPIRSLRSCGNTAKILYHEAVRFPPRPGCALKDKRTLTVGGGKNTYMS